MILVSKKYDKNHSGQWIVECKTDMSFSQLNKFIFKQ